MKKQVGIFSGKVSDPHPCWCTITINDRNALRFDHRDLADLEYLVSQMKRMAKEQLPDNYKHEV